MSITLHLSGEAPVNSSKDICDIFSVEFANKFFEPTIATRKNRFCSYDSNTKVLQNFNIDITTVYQSLKNKLA